MIPKTLTLEEMARRAMIDYEASLNATDAVKMAERREDCGRWIYAIRQHPELGRESWTVWIERTTGIPRIEVKSCLSAFNSLTWREPPTARGKARRLAYLTELSEAGGSTPEGQALQQLLEEIKLEEQERYNAPTE